MTDLRSKHRLPVILGTETVVKSRLFQIEQVHLKFTNGVERHYERLRGSGRGAVMVAALQGSDLLLIREYAVGTESYELGLPKGLIDPGETIEQAAVRELREEIGFAAGQLTLLRSITLAPAYMGSQMNILVAEQLFSAPLEGDEPEPLELLRWPLAELDALVQHPEFSEARSIAAVYMLINWLKERDR